MESLLIEKEEMIRDLKNMLNVSEEELTQSSSNINKLITCS